MKPRNLSAVLLILASAGSAALAQSTLAERESWNQPVEPFRIIGNLYYAGVSGVSSFLITSPNGAILIDAGFPESAPLIDHSISRLGFQASDVKYLLSTHAHDDHSGGLAELKRRSGAQLIASAADAPALEKGRHSHYDGKDFFAPPVRVDRRIGDGETVQLGDVIVTAHLTPGHTKGCTTWTTSVAEAGKTYNVVFYCSTSVVDRLVNNRAYPQIVPDYEHTFAELRKLPCDVFLAPHGFFFHLAEKRARLAGGGPNPFIDPAEFPAFVDQSERDFRSELHKQRSAAKK